ncbi:MAG: diaminopropionate ammonia-lyase [Rhizobiales bacterium]|nr:diaminopropionate ammonia-lyase [Hyphomicrobiales bacterium]
MIFENHRSTQSSKSRLFRSSADRPLELLQQCPVYEPTPLRDLSTLAEECRVASLQVKDETKRMQLGSFKALGGAFAVAQIVKDAAGTADLMGEHAKQVASGMTFITASAGNHGLSVAAGTHIFGANGIIVLCASVPEGFANRIRRAGAEVVHVKGSYEDSVSHAIKTAHENDWILLADGSWQGYIERPALVMEGYTILAEECRATFDENDSWPDHVLVQAGVGGLASALAANIREYWPVQPIIAVVEPDAAPCLITSIEAGELKRVDGPVSNMGRLDCKDASLIAFEALRMDADRFVTVTDDEASAAADTLAKHGIVTTPSGAAALAALKNMQLPASARCLLIATEGPEEG